MVKSFKKNDKINKKTEKIKDIIIIDKHCKYQNNDHSILVEDEEIYKITWNKTNLSGNNNKFYILEIIKESDNSYILYKRYGRVGQLGRMDYKAFNSKDLAIKEFNKTIKSKTRNKYIKVHLNIKVNEEKELDNDLKGMNLETVDLIKLIFDKTILKKDLDDLGFNSNKMPLGELTNDAFNEAFKILGELNKQIENKNYNEIENLNNNFFSLIPHVMEYRNIKANIINTKEKVTEKNLMLVSLKNLKITDNALNTHSKLSNLYKSLNTDIKLIDKNSNRFKILEEGLINTCAKTHYFNPKVKNIFVLDKKEDFDEKMNNRILLWHGSRISNFGGILTQSLRIAPPEAPVSGYMFGKGVYFADLFSKSAQYSVKGLSNNTGILLLCEVGIGNPRIKYQSDYNANILPNGYHSTLGNGKTISSSTIDVDNAKFYNGKLINNPDQNGSLLYNEYIVYNTNQIKMKYLFEVKFE